MEHFERLASVRSFPLRSVIVQLTILSKVLLCTLAAGQHVASRDFIWAGASAACLSMATLPHGTLALQSLAELLSGRQAGLACQTALACQNLHSCRMLQESEYASWVLCNGYNLNHTTVAVHKLERMRWMLTKLMCCVS